MTIKPSRTQLVQWVNEILDLPLQKVDDFGNGAVYCQIMDTIYGDLPMQRVKFEARTSLEMETNYKVLQMCFSKHGINKKFDFRKLMKCRLQDNLDFTQWIYTFWQENHHIPDYDPRSRRTGIPGSVPRHVRSPSVSSRTSNMSRRSSSINLQPREPQSAKNPGKGLGLQRDMTPGQIVAPQIRRSSSRISSSHIPSPAMAALQAENTSIKEEMIALHRCLDVLTDERALYFDKLVEIENLVEGTLTDKYNSGEDVMKSTVCKSDPVVELVRKIQSILYSSPEGFFPDIRPEDEPF